jgi:hypothetical protein
VGIVSPVVLIAILFTDITENFKDIFRILILRQFSWYHFQLSRPILTDYHLKKATKFNPGGFCCFWRQNASRELFSRLQTAIAQLRISLEGQNWYH